MAKVEEKLRSAARQGTFPVFYPGTQGRCDAAKAAYPDRATEIDLGPGSSRPCSKIPGSFGHRVP